MGIPTFFLSIIRNKFYKNVHKGINKDEVDCDYFFMDYNGIVYGAYENVKNNFTPEMTKDDIEEIIIAEVIRYTKYLITEVVRPKKVTYIALDGPAPRAKMIQQRERRYKGYYEKILFQEEKKNKKYNIDGADNNSNNQNNIEWDRSANISPGTMFMEKLSNALIKVMKNKGFSTHCQSERQMEVYLSNSNVPGEGEHKFLSIIRSMRQKKSTENLKVYLYGKDADLIVLAISTHKTNVHVIREMQIETSELRKLYPNSEFIDLNIDSLSSAFNHDLTKTFKNHQFDKIRILNDYIFLTFLVGNDFVISLPFMKIRKDGLKILIAIYHDIKLNHSGYLVNYNIDDVEPPTVNLNFFIELIDKISEKEDDLMKEQQRDINKHMKGFVSNYRSKSEAESTPFQIFMSRYTHLEVCNPDHPQYNKYFAEFKKVDYSKSYEEWKEAYYNFYVGINKNDPDEYLDKRMDIVKNYLESIMFNLKYYFQGCPSWQWHYRFRIAPLLSDVKYALENSLINPNELAFEQGEPYTPFQQLMLILPPQMSFLVPKVLQPIMTDDKFLCTQFYPTEFRIDVTNGIKIEYSEAILPEIDEEHLITIVKKQEEKLTVEEKKRNTIQKVKK
jgi:5'-3' exonuclease